MQWTLEAEDGPRRVNHAAVSVQDRYVFSFGGFYSGDEYSSLEKMDVHIFDLDLLKWTKLKTPTIEDDDYDFVPFMRYGHTASVIGDKIYIFGGCNNRYVACNTLFCFDTTTFRWSTPEVSGSIPPACDGHSACVIGEKIYLFGGFEERGGYHLQSECFSKDVYVLDVKTMKWTHPHVFGEPASWRDFHTATAVGKYMYIFGGRGDVLGEIHSNQEIYDNQIIVFDTETYTWQWLVTKGLSPIGRRSHTAVSYGRCIYIFGGYNGLEQQHYGDILKFDTDARQWSKVVVPGKYPCPRRRHCCCLVGGKAVIFGGSSPFHGQGAQGEEENSLQDHNDLYVLDLNPTLKTLCKLAVVKHKLYNELLPRMLKRELAVMFPKTSTGRIHSPTLLSQG
ncbi:kelch domain-containing protein 3-like isoform X1 [Dendronephthya gigantea]|uniref:kelch domain-containing protein 3-like isoform X1 n=1 Tax=Dendronephthya gigantea TaxID=151771 RepID=UPI0010690CC6|nr:kelch domain-containing protein 3-like isoform X1 [Dendronephthya gigantea]